MQINEETISKATENEITMNDRFQKRRLNKKESKFTESNEKTISKNGCNIIAAIELNIQIDEKERSVPMKNQSRQAHYINGRMSTRSLSSYQKETVYFADWGCIQMESAFYSFSESAFIKISDDRLK